MSVEFDFHELTEFQKQVMQSANDNFPKEAKNFMQRAGNSLAKSIRSGYDSKTRKKTGNLRKGVSRGRAYKWNGREWQIRVRNKAPHAHLLEYGHRMVAHDGKTVSKKTPWVKGRHVVGAAANDFTGTFNEMCIKFVDEFLEKGGF